MSRKSRFCAEKIRKMRDAKNTRILHGDDIDGQEEGQSGEFESSVSSQMNLLRTKKRKKNFQSNQKTCAMREAKLKKLSDSQSREEGEAAKLPVTKITRSSPNFKKVESLNQPCTVNLALLTEGLQRCQTCKQGPLNLKDVNQEVEFHGACPIIKLTCKKCSEINIIRPNNTHRIGTRGPPAHDTNTRAALGALDAGIGHTHYASLLSTMGIPALSHTAFKKREREAGNAVESIAKRTCPRYTEEEKELTGKDNQVNVENETVDVTVSYDMSWRKRGKAFDSSSGMGSVIGAKTRKVIAYGTRNQQCRTCKQAECLQRSPKIHDCKVNHEGSSKSMEASLAVELFNEAPQRGMRYSTYVGDEDSTTESRL